MYVLAVRVSQARQLYSYFDTIVAGTYRDF